MDIVRIDGDGIGKEVMPPTVALLDRVTRGGINWIPARMGLECFEHCGDPLPQVTLDLVRTHKLAIKGPTTTPQGGGFQSVNVRLRRELDLYVGLRPAMSLGLPGRHERVNIHLFRENTEGLYDSTEALSLDGQSVTLTAHFTRRAMLRLARAAFLYARLFDLDTITYVDKQNIHKVWGRLYHGAFLEVAVEFPDISYNHRLVDAANMFLALSPESWGLIVTANMFGDILADHLAAIMGGLGVAPGANIGDEIFVAEAVHGSWPEKAGNGIANPTALMLSGAMLLEHMGEMELAGTIRNAIIRTLTEGDRTADLGGTLSTTEFAEAVLRRL